MADSRTIRYPRRRGSANTRILDAAAPRLARLASPRVLFREGGGGDDDGGAQSPATYADDRRQRRRKYLCRPGPLFSGTYGISEEKRSERRPIFRYGMADPTFAATNVHIPQLPPFLLPATDLAAVASRTRVRNKRIRGARSLLRDASTRMKNPGGEGDVAS